VRDLEAWLAAAGVTRPAFFVGHSLGCHIIRTYVARHPDAASAMLLVDARPPHFERTVLDAGIAIPVPPPESGIAKEFTLADDIVSGLWVPEGVAAAAICSDRFDAAPGALAGPESDEVVRLWRDAQADIARSIGQASLTVVLGTGHRVPTEAPDYVASAIRGLIDRRRDAGRLS
jgi:pimeloyl-ACP methyl ester carboxylesterase